MGERDEWTMDDSRFLSIDELDALNDLADMVSDNFSVGAEYLSASDWLANGEYDY